MLATRTRVGDAAAENGAGRAENRRAEEVVSRPMWNRTSKEGVTTAVPTVTKQLAVASQCARRGSRGMTCVEERKTHHATM